MGRPKRAAEGGVIYHVLNRANARMTIFEDDHNYEAFERIVEEAVHRYDMRLLAFQIMPNHTTGSGHLYQGRFKSFPVEDDGHFLTVCRYVERNALRAGLVDRAEDWRWASSSGRCPPQHAGHAASRQSRCSRRLRSRSGRSKKISSHSI